MNKWLSDIRSGCEDNYMLPFYWQHGDHHDTIPKEIERIYNSGCRAFCVESRTHKDFCRDQWWADMNLIISEAERRGMKVWIFDDDHYPTGHAAGAVKDHPELRKWNLIERHVDVVGPCTDSYLLINPDNADNILLGIYAYKRTGEDEDCVPEPLPLSDVSDGFLRFSLPDGVYRVFFLYKSRRGSSRGDYIDMLREESVRLLIDTVYEPQYEHYKKYFGNTIAGFFSDEPSLGNTWFASHSEDHGGYNTRVGMPGLALPWNDRVTGMMRDALGYDPVPYLPALWFGFGSVTGDVRHAYMDAVTKLYRDCFTRQLGDWCEAHGVQYIGHIIEDMNAHARLGCSCGHYFRSLDGQHMSGIDIVLHQIIPGTSDHIHTASAFGNKADPEFFEYVLPKLGSSFARIGTQTERRAMCEVFGAYGWAEGSPMMKWLMDFLLVRGINRFIPHAFSPTFPDPDCPPHFGAGDCDPQYEGFSKIMSVSNRTAHLLSHGKPVVDAAILYHADAEWYGKFGTAMLSQVPAKMLYDSHIDYDILPADCFVEGSGSRVYMASVEDGTIRVGENRYRCLIVPYADVLPHRLDKALKDLEEKGFTVIRMEKECSKESLVNRTMNAAGRDITVDGNYPKLRCAHYSYDGTDVYMFVNESVTEPVDTKITLRGAGSRPALLLDMYNDAEYATKTENGEVRIALAPYQSVILAVGEDTAAPELPAKTETAPAELEFSVACADYRNMDDYHPVDGNLPAIPPGFSGRIRYRAKFTAPEGVKGIDLGEVGQSVRLSCNGTDLGVRVCPPYSYDLTEVLREGENELEAVVSTTLAGAIRDGFSYNLAIPRSGIAGPVRWKF